MHLPVASPARNLSISSRKWRIATAGAFDFWTHLYLIAA